MFVYICVNNNGLLGIGKISSFIIHPFNPETSGKKDEKLNLESLLFFSTAFWP